MSSVSIRTDNEKGCNLKKKWQLFDVIELTCLLPLLLLVAYPGVLTVSNHYILCLVCETIWLFLATIRSPKIMRRIIKKVWFAIPYMLYVGIFPYLMGNPSIGNRYIGYSSWIFGIYIFLYYSVRNKLHVVGTAINISIPFLLFSMVNTISAALTNAYIARQIDVDEIWFSYMRRGVGGYHFIYSLVIVSVLCFVMFFLEKRGRRYLFLGMSIFALFVVIASNFMTALLACSVGYITTIFCALWRKNKPIALMTALVFVPVVICVDIILSNSIIGMFNDGGRIFGALSKSNSILQAVVDEFLRDRWPTMNESLMAFEQNPFWGLVSDIIKQRDGHDVGYGQHSYILDTFALFGVGIGIMSIVILFWPFKNMSGYSNNRKWKNVFVIVCFIQSLFNNMTLSIMVMFTVVCPYYLNITLQFAEQNRELKVQKD